MMLCASELWSAKCSFGVGGKGQQAADTKNQKKHLYIYTFRFGNVKNNALIEGTTTHTGLFQFLVSAISSAS